MHTSQNKQALWSVDRAQNTFIRSDAGRAHKINPSPCVLVCESVCAVAATAAAAAGEIVRGA